MEDDILIDNYLKGLLSENDQKSFLERLESDTDFSKIFKLEKQLFNSLNEESWSFVENKNTDVSAYLKLL
jgi:anti-sigma-K factor RskA